MALVACLLTAGCTQKQQNSGELRRETAHATSVIKQDVKAVAQGVHDGLRSDHVLNLNEASKNELLDLPGVTAARAGRIITSRPFGSTNELVTRRILSEADYDRIKDRIRVGKPSPSIN